MRHGNALGWAWARALDAWGLVGKGRDASPPPLFPRPRPGGGGLLGFGRQLPPQLIVGCTPPGVGGGGFWEGR